MRYHDLRHNLASMLAAEGYGLASIQEILRHSTGYITLEYYAHLFPKAKNDALNSIEQKYGLSTQNPPNGAKSAHKSQ